MALSTLSFLARKLGYDLFNWQVELTESILGGNDVVLEWVDRQPWHILDWLSDQLVCLDCWVLVQLVVL